MKNIELTEDHKSKLLEMCKKLFPSYFNWKFGPISEGFDNEIWFSWRERNQYKNEEIHWFEFCFHYLCPKVIGKGYSLTVNSFYIQHPIDFLYERFKNIK